MASFLSGLMGGKADELVDKGVDAAATLAKQKVKSLIGGESNPEDGNAGGGGGGMAGILSPGSKDGGGGDGGIGGLFSSGGKAAENESSGEGAGGDSGDFTDALAGVANEMSGNDDPMNQLKSIGKGLFG
ncbi:uncharacterized PE-PGRS family protein PE_PGRS20-like [Anguilla anguilla]|uniref:uncharacterized PE-PGRS family protein PE_PGRS20-like n=1 Tax=Anguilla anguilla TaxID=7936 RepID=UPI0015B0D3EF|nr:uncharacterized PE-PGRS family protein PE_PGRS20-like [Anguilla anguilla]